MLWKKGVKGCDMYLLKKIILGLGLLVLIYGGSAGTQSSSLFVQGMSFIGLLVILIILYVFSKMILRGLGCFPSFLIMSGIGLFMMYALGMFNNGIMGVFDSVSRFIGRDASQKETEAPKQSEPVTTNIDSSVKEEAVEVALMTENQISSPELFNDIENNAEKMLEETTPKEEPKKGLLDNVISAISGKQEAEEPRPFNPHDFPVFYASARVINGDTLEIFGKYFKLFGIAAPEISQTCANAQGRSYNCGRQAASWLKDWIEDGELECHVIQQDTKGNMIGTCSYGPYDLGAALVNAGWAVAYTKYTDAYLPYEEQAKQDRRGLWQGQFYKPWDWKKIQQRQNKVKVIQPKKKGFDIFG